jgi:two-component system nitrogen regulation sensor histidine kinase NtrY
VLCNARGHIVHANSAARHLLHGGRRLEGLRLDDVLRLVPAPLREAVEAEREGLFGVELDGAEEVFHLGTRSFRLNGQLHRLYLIRHMTRVISHELNNSLAPISSLAHSGRTLAERGDSERLLPVLATIGERARHLAEFIRGYAAFAKLPSPRTEAIDWPEFLGRLQHHMAFRVAGGLPAKPGQGDPGQLEQALINLLKNAHESGTAADTVELAVIDGASEFRIEVRDRGPGMSEPVLASALVPFYSTKRSGTGLGLALAREIAEAHGGRISLANRDGGGLVARLSLPHG